MVNQNCCINRDLLKYCNIIYKYIQNEMNFHSILSYFVFVI